jgi:ATP-dependent Zn protease
VAKRTQTPRFEPARLQNTFAAWTRAAAVHEAAHAVIGWVLGLRCGGAAIEGIGGGYSYVDDPKQPDQAEAWLAMSMAGSMAERLILERLSGGSDGDRKRERKVIARFRLGPGRVQRAREMAEELINEHRDAILRVADALEARRGLTRAEINALLSTRWRSAGTSSGPAK